MAQAEKMIQQELWRTEQEILDVIHKICVGHNLRYSLAYGTLLGAVRHKGFIPWDDDIDIIMPRNDYEKLLSIWNAVAPQGYILQNTRTDPDFSQNFSKIRKDHTTFLQDESERAKQYHKGIFVDIFPGDRVAPNRLGRKIQYIACAINLLYCRGHKSGSKGIIGMVESILLQTPENNFAPRREKAEKWIRRWNDNNELQYLFPNTITWCKKHYPVDMFDTMGEIEFNGKRYMCVEDYDAILKLDYGNYMQLPPEKDRVWKHHPILIDFTRNYEELSEDES